MGGQNSDPTSILTESGQRDHNIATKDAPNAMEEHYNMISSIVQRQKKETAGQNVDRQNAEAVDVEPKQQRTSNDDVVSTIIEFG